MNDNGNSANCKFTHMPVCAGVPYYRQLISRGPAPSRKTAHPRSGSRMPHAGFKSTTSWSIGQLSHTASFVAAPNAIAVTAPPPAAPGLKRHRRGAGKTPSKRGPSTASHCALRTEPLGSRSSMACCVPTAAQRVLEFLLPPQLRQQELSPRGAVQAISGIAAEHCTRQ